MNGNLERIPVHALVLAAATLAAGCGDSSSGAGGDLDASDRGTIVENRPILLFTAPGVPFPGTSQFIKYRSTDHEGRPVLVTGTVTTPLLPWSGPGERPIVAFAVGTHGVGDACASSLQMAQGLDYEASGVLPLLLQGYGVVITDYVGVGTDEPSTFANRLAQGHAVLDSIRAAQRLPEANLPADGPVAIWGYSLGGEGSGAAMELQPRYAPELHLIGGYAAAIPSDLCAAVNFVDGGPYAALAGLVINGMDAAFPENGLFAELNDAGKAFVAATSGECIPLILVPHALTRSSTLFTDGRSLGDHLGDSVWQAPMAAQFIGHAKPAGPVFVATSIADDVIPFASTRDAAARWCALGATVQFSAVPVPLHLGASYEVAALQALAWLGDRVAGRPAPSNCGTF